MKRLVLVDGHALLHRAYHATPPLSTSKGELVNAAYGFTSILLRTWEELSPDYLCVTWDLEAPTFRHEAYENYKGTRKAGDEALFAQHDRVKEILDAFNIPQFSLKGYEADDLIASLTRQALAAEKVLEVIILTGDRDIMQIISKRVKVLMPKKTINDVGIYGEEEFALRFGFSPELLVDYKGLAGDQSDNIPGVPGVGEVTAMKLIQQYGTLEKVYKSIKELPERTQRLLEAGKESAFMSKKLATLDSEAPVTLDLSACRVHEFDREKVRSLFEELEFKSLIPRIPGVHHGEEESQNRSLTDAQDDKSSQFTTDLDHQVEPILQKMSESGVLVDLEYLGRMGQDLKSQLAALEKDIYSAVGHEFNINSPKQLQVILFDELKLPVIKKTKTGRSTDEETLTELIAAHPLIPLLLKYRQLYKLVSTYVDALPKYVGSDGRIHSKFNVEGAATGRITSQEPNLQNIPIRGELGAELRKTFIAAKGKVLLGADYSQIELRILADLTQDPFLQAAFEEGLDIHTATTAKIFQISPSDVTKEQRSVGKTVNFATLYGQGAHALSRQLGIDYKEARSYIEEYFAQFPKVKEWMNKVLEEAHQKGYTQTLWGRKRYLPELKSTNHSFRAFGERAAVNHPIQGTAADMIKKAMVDIENDSRFTSGECRMILQVHDELVFECDPKNVEEIGKIVKEKMENALKLSVPVIVDIKSGPNWGEMQPLSV